MSFSETLKRLRLEKGLTQGDLAKYSGLKQSSIAMYETGKRNPKIDVLERLADFFNVDIDYLIGKTDKTTKVIVAPPEPQKSDGLPELNARDEREIERDLADMMHSVAMANYTAPGEKEDAEALEAALRFAMVQAKRMAKKKYTPRKYRKDER